MRRLKTEAVSFPPPRGPSRPLPYPRAAEFWTLLTDHSFLWVAKIREENCSDSCRIQKLSLSLSLSLLPQGKRWALWLDFFFFFYIMENRHAEHTVAKRQIASIFLCAGCHGKVIRDTFCGSLRVMEPLTEISMLVTVELDEHLEKTCTRRHVLSMKDLCAVTGKHHLDRHHGNSTSWVIEAKAVILSPNFVACVLNILWIIPSYTQIWGDHQC